MEVKIDRKMDPEWKAKWVAALRSGEYRQGKMQLTKVHPDGSMDCCCLGVLCEITGTPSITTGLGNRQYGYGGMDTLQEMFLPFETAIKVGINPDTMPNTPCGFLANRNDGKMDTSGTTIKWDFNAIADWIEANL